MSFGPLSPVGKMLKSSPLIGVNAIYDLLNMDLKILDLQSYKFKDYSQITMNKEQITNL